MHIKIAVLVFAAGLVASAQELSKEAKIERILTLTNANAMMDQVVDQMKGMLASFAPAGTTPAEKAKRSKVEGQLLDLVKSRWERLRPQFVTIYSETFTEEEIDGLLGFYRSPVGQAMIQKMPAMLTKTMTLMQAQMKDILPEIQRISKEAR